MPPKPAPRRPPSRRNVKANPPVDEPAGTPIPANAMDDSPVINDSAVPEPVESRPPATNSVTSSSTRAPVQRLESLNRRPSPATSSGAGPPGAPGAKAKAPMKFKPKSVIRRSKEERDAQERLEAERRQARLAAAGAGTQEASRGGRGGFRGSRGRGGFTGPGRGGWQNRGDRPGEGAMSGPFGSGVYTREEAAKKIGRGGSRSSAMSNSDSPSQVKNEPGVKVEGGVIVGSGFSGGGTRVKIEDQGAMYISSDDEEHENEGPRMNIEQINLVSDEDPDEEMTSNKGKGRARESKIPGWVLKPIRIDRKEHIERAVGVNIEASSQTSAELRKRAKERGDNGDSLFVPMDEEGPRADKTKKKGKQKMNDVEFLRDERKWKGVYQDDKDLVEGAKIKTEPTEDDDMAIDITSTNIAATANAAKDTETAPSPAAPVPENAEPSITPVPKKRRNFKFKDTKPILQTEEDRQEWARHEEDVRFLDQELRLMDTGPTALPLSTTTDEEGKSSQEERALKTNNEQKEGRIYLVQLPPIVPALTDAIIKAESSPVPNDVPLPAQTPIIPPNPSRQPSTPATAPKKTPIKRDPSPPPQPQLHTPSLTPTPGLLGTLKLKQSGRVLLSWGDASLELVRGADTEFLQDVVLANARKVVSVDDELGMGTGVEVGDGVGGGGRTGKSGWGLGQVMGNFVVRPDWGRLFGR